MEPSARIEEVQNKTATYKIRQVIDLTGASEFLLRTWELRYAALKPQRSKTGRRLYKEADVLKARALLALTQQGHRVGDIASLSLSELNQMISEESAAHTKDDFSPAVKNIISKASGFHWHEVRNLIRRAKGDPIEWVHSLVVPLLIEMGRQVDNRNFSVAQEHIMSAIIKDSVAHRLHGKSPAKNGPRIVFSAPEGDYHDLGITIAARMAAELKANTLYLGAHMPKDELATVCIRYKATHLLLSSTTTPKQGTKDDFLSYLNFLDRNLDPRITIWVAGKNAMNCSVALSRPFKVIESFQAFESEVRKCLK